MATSAKKIGVKMNRTPTFQTFTHYFVASEASREKKRFVSQQHSEMLHGVIIIARLSAREFYGNFLAPHTTQAVPLSRTLCAARYMKIVLPLTQNQHLNCTNYN